MTDFFDDLERHLDQAARRQARWGRLAGARRAPLAAVPVLCVAALLAIAAPQLGDREAERGPVGAPGACDPPSASVTPDPVGEDDFGRAEPGSTCEDSREADGERGTPVPEGWTSYTPREGCGVPADLLEAYPALEDDGKDDWAQLLETTASGPAGLRSAALVHADEETEFWLMAKLACETPGERTDRVCVVPVRPEYDELSALCATLREIEEGPKFMSFRAGGEVAVAGFVPAGGSAVEVLHDGATLTTLPVVSGIFGGLARTTEPPQEGELEILAIGAQPD